ncbi:MAG TPA: 2-oxoglutarate dehydrogenase, E2 component, dihydrolipoamide succinyltransferase [Terracidiphilus sp.]|nr:2-oxoglutarate dehydrogenase, E2 component, dihydrolipoamide succinyltransferase [Terracidiphilus sp.]
MPTDVLMPQMGESIFEGTITKWLKKPGDRVEKDEPLLEISTDKVDAEIPAPAAGILSEIKFPEGATVTVNTVLAILGGPVSAPATAPAAKPQSAAPQVPAPKAQPIEPREQSAPPQVVVMPQMGESIFEGTITKWLKKPGDRVEKDEPLLEISTDKVDAEIPAPAAGILSEIKFPEGATVTVNTVLAILGGPSGLPLSQQSFPNPNESAAPQVAAKPQSNAPEVQPKAQLAAPQGSQVHPGRKLRSSPLVRRIALEHNINLALVRGTGSEGRITKDDILAYLSQPASARPATAPQITPPQQPVSDLPGKVVPLSKMRGLIAQRMLESKRISPHAHSVYKIDMTRIARLRERHRAAFEQKHGIKLTYMPFIAAATVEALRRFPVLNASLVGSDIHYHASVNLGIAVALDWGLIVPVIGQAEQKSFPQIALAIQDLAARARSKKLQPNEVEGSTFTLTNAGVFGGEFGTPIINQPEAAILAVGGLRKEPVVLTDAEGNDTIAIRSMQFFCLGFDHRLIDGADSGKFMLDLKHTLETWDRDVL